MSNHVEVAQCLEAGVSHPALGVRLVLGVVAIRQVQAMEATRGEPPQLHLTLGVEEGEEEVELFQQTLAVAFVASFCSTERFLHLLRLSLQGYPQARCPLLRVPLLLLKCPRPILRFLCQSPTMGRHHLEVESSTQRNHQLLRPTLLPRTPFVPQADLGEWKLRLW
jgi:hypothetical protein